MAFLLRLGHGLVYTFLVGSANNSAFYLTGGDIVLEDEGSRGGQGLQFTFVHFLLSWLNVSRIEQCRNVKKIKQLSISFRVLCLNLISDEPQRR